MLPSSARLLQEEAAANCRAITADLRNSSSAAVALPSVVIEPVDVNDDDPPPYSAVAPPNHTGWPFSFSGIRYSGCGATSCRAAEATPLAGFQTGRTSPGSGFHPEGTDGQPASISMPLMPCRLFMFGSHRSLFAHAALPFTDNISVSKDDHGRRTRKYGAILIGAAVIVFLMALSLLVRFVMDKSLWRG